MKSLWFGCTIAIVAFGDPRVCLGQAVFELVPVLPQGLTAAPYPPGTMISGNHITFPAPGGFPVWLELRFRNWAPNQLSLWQAGAEPTTFASGTGDALQSYRPACASNLDCQNAVGVGLDSTCGSFIPNVCSPVFQQTSRADFVFSGGFNANSANLDVLRSASFTFGPALADNSSTKYGGTGF